MKKKKKKKKKKQQTDQEKQMLSGNNTTTTTSSTTELVDMAKEESEIIIGENIEKKTITSTYITSIDDGEGDTKTTAKTNETKAIDDTESNNNNEEDENINNDKSPPDDDDNNNDTTHIPLIPQVHKEIPSQIVIRNSMLLRKHTESLSSLRDKYIKKRMKKHIIINTTFGSKQFVDMLVKKKRTSIDMTDTDKNGEV